MARTCGQSSAVMGSMVIGIGSFYRSPRGTPVALQSRAAQLGAVSARCVANGFFPDTGRALPWLISGKHSTSGSTTMKTALASCTLVVLAACIGCDKGTPGGAG